MPELPEVESVRRGLEAAGPLGTVTSVYRSRLALRVGACWRPERVRELAGRSITGTGRRGKYLWLTLGPAHDPWALLIHLGMSGRLDVCAPSPRPPHPHLELGLSGGRRLRFVDPRRFGAVRAGPLAELEARPPVAGLGPDALTEPLTGGELRARARGRKRPIWDLLMDQGFVAGLGNIYAQEILWHARVHPLRRSDRLPTAAWDRLATASAQVLRAALDHGGTTLRDYRNARGEPGSHQGHLHVYGRAGEACACGRTIRATTHAGRTVSYCPRCQSPPRPRT